MPLTSAQQKKVVTLLGWPAKSLDNTSLSYMSQIYARVQLNDADTEALVTDYLTRIATLDQNLLNAQARAGVKSIDDIEFFGDANKGSSEFALLRNERKRLIIELASILDLAVGPGANGAFSSVGVGV